MQRKSRVSGEPDLAGAYAEMNDPNFWISLQKTPDKVLMTPTEISAFTQKIASTEGTNCVDLASFPDTLSRDELMETIRTYAKPEEPRYQGDKIITDEQYNRYFENRNEQAVGVQNPVQWGIVVGDCELRTYPTLDAIYDLANDFEFDLCCETVLKTGECVAVLAASADNNWFLVQAYNYLGWVEQKNIATTDKASWLALVKPSDVLVITGNRVTLDHNNVTPATSRRELTMGTRLPLVVDKPAFVDGIKTDLSQLTEEQRIKEILKQPVGTIMYMPGHIVLYLGDYQGKPYIFHQAFALAPPDGQERVQVATALVSDLSIKRANGQKFTQSITDLIVLQSPEQ